MAQKVAKSSFYCSLVKYSSLSTTPHHTTLRVSETVILGLYFLKKENLKKSRLCS